MGFMVLRPGRSRAMRSSVRIIGTGFTPLYTRKTSNGKTPSDLMQIAVQRALAEAQMPLSVLDGIVAVPALAEHHFMEAHFQATKMGLLPRKNVKVRTIDTGGAGPVSALLAARSMIMNEGCNAVAVLAGDAVSSMDTEAFLKKADQGCRHPFKEIQSPVIPHGYSRVTQWHQRTYGTTREQLAMCSVLMSAQASRHPYALTRKPHTLEEVLAAPAITPHLGLLECARRADGGAALIVASTSFMQDYYRDNPPPNAVIVGGGEASGPLYPPDVIDEEMFSCEEAAWTAYDEAQLSHRDIDFFGLYDCFPICLLRAIEASHLAPKGEGGLYIEKAYNEYLKTGRLDHFPVNTHGGLLGFGAPWEVPAMYNIIEAVKQLTRKAQDRQIPNCRRALVYGNGGIFSHSAIAILGDGDYL